MRVLALDVGSSSTRACAYDERGREAGEPARRAYEARHGPGGAAELDADELVRASEAVLAEAGAGPDATGISCFWHSLLLLDEHERPLTPVLLWQDRRSVAQAEELRARLDPAAVHARTGCFLHPSYWPAKLAWAQGAGHARPGAAHRLVCGLPLPAADRRAARRRSRPRPAPACSTCARKPGTESCSTPSVWTSDCCRRSTTSRQARCSRRSATGPARTSVPGAQLGSERR